MAIVKGKTVPMVSYDVLGIAETMRMLEAKGAKIEAGADLGVVRALSMVQEEVKESIAGRRAEPKSVDTGKFINSIDIEKTGKAEGKVYPNMKETYPNVLEYGSSKLSPRKHFRNTKARTQDKVREIIDREVKSEIKKR